MSQEFYAVDLPGKSLYDKEFSVSIRKITPIEQKYILSLSQKEQKSNRDYINFIKKLTVIDNPEVQFEDLFWFDVQYILYRIRFTTYAKHPIKLSLTCDNTIQDEDGNTVMCGNLIKHELNADELKIYTPEDITDFERTINLENLGEIKIRNKIIRDDITIEEFMRKHKIDQKDFQYRLLLVDLCSISGEKTLEEMYNLAEEGTITAEDIFAIEEWIQKHVWGVEEKLSYVCSKCGKEETRDYSLSLEDFFSAI